MLYLTLGRPCHEREPVFADGDRPWASLYLASLRDRGEAEARRHFDRFRSIAVEPEDEWLFEAMALKARRPKLSYADTIGYTIARRLGARFLTGDEAFRRLPDVEFCR